MSLFWTSLYLKVLNLGRTRGALQNQTVGLMRKRRETLRPQTHQGQQMVLVRKKNKKTGKN